MRIVVVDDERNSRELMKTLLAMYCNEVNIKTASDVLSAVDTINSFKPHLIFLDIELKGETGFSVLKKFKDASFLVCFATGYVEYALQAANSHAFGYLVKPIDIEELKEVVNRARNKIKDLPDPSQLNTILIQEAADYWVIDTAMISYIVSEDSYNFLYKVDGEKILTTKSLSYYEDILPENMFYRSHRSAILNFSFIKQIKEARTGKATMKDGREIPIANRRSKEFWSKFNKLST